MDIRHEEACRALIQTIEELQINAQAIQSAAGGGGGRATKRQKTMQMNKVAVQENIRKDLQVRLLEELGVFTRRASPKIQSTTQAPELRHILRRIYDEVKSIQGGESSDRLSKLAKDFQSRLRLIEPEADMSIELWTPDHGHDDHDSSDDEELSLAQAAALIKQKQDREEKRMQDKVAVAWKKLDWNNSSDELGIIEDTESVEEEDEDEDEEEDDDAEESEDEEDSDEEVDEERENNDDEFDEGEHNVEVKDKEYGVEGNEKGDEAEVYEQRDGVEMMREEDMVEVKVERELSY